MRTENQCYQVTGIISMKMPYRDTRLHNEYMMETMSVATEAWAKVCEYVRLNAWKERETDSVGTHEQVKFHVFQDRSRTIYQIFIEFIDLELRETQLRAYEKRLNAIVSTVQVSSPKRMTPRDIMLADLRMKMLISKRLA